MRPGYSFRHVVLAPPSDLPAPPMPDWADIVVGVIPQPDLGAAPSRGSPGREQADRMVVVTAGGYG